MTLPLLSSPDTWELFGLRLAKVIASEQRHQLALAQAASANVSPFDWITYSQADGVDQPTKPTVNVGFSGLTLLRQVGRGQVYQARYAVVIQSMYSPADEASGHPSRMCSLRALEIARVLRRIITASENQALGMQALGVRSVQVLRSLENSSLFDDYKGIYGHIVTLSVEAEIEERADVPPAVTIDGIDATFTCADSGEILFSASIP